MTEHLKLCSYQGAMTQYLLRRLHQNHFRSVKKILRAHQCNRLFIKVCNNSVESCDHYCVTSASSIVYLQTLGYTYITSLMFPCCVDRKMKVIVLYSVMHSKVITRHNN